MTFNRFESYKKAIQDKSIDFNALQVMIDFHMVKGTLTAEEGQILMGMISGGI